MSEKVIEVSRTLYIDQVIAAANSFRLDRFAEALAHVQKYPKFKGSFRQPKKMTRRHLNEAVNICRKHLLVSPTTITLAQWGPQK